MSKKLFKQLIQKASTPHPKDQDPQRHPELKKSQKQDKKPEKK